LNGRKKELNKSKVDAIIFSPPYSERSPRLNTPRHLSQDHSLDNIRKERAGVGSKENLTNLQYGKIGTIIFSLPYLETDSSQSHMVENVLFFKPTPSFQGYKQFFHSESVAHPAKANLHMLRWIIERYTKEGDVVLDPMAGTGSTGIIACYLNRKAVLIDLEQKFVDMMKRNIKRFKEACKFWKVERPEPVAMQGDSRQLSNVLRQVDSIIFSPPFSHSKVIEDMEFYKKNRIDQGVSVNTLYIQQPQLREDNIGVLRHGKIDRALAQTGSNTKNIGNAKGETYLSAMLKVYRECWKVLKPNGKMIVMVRNFIRNKRIVRLDLDTIKLCEKAGFRLVERWYSQRKQQSFWRNNYYQKYPYAPKIKYEHILVFEKCD